jgi:hypothetical protein
LVKEASDISQKPKGKASKVKLSEYAEKLEKEFKGKSTPPVRAKNIVIGVVTKK